MSQEFHAIFENGVLRPLTPLNLHEATEVTGILRAMNEAEDVGAPPPNELQRQQAALNAMFCEIDRIPQSPRNDGLTGRDHDRILYGSTQ
jgi:hypothetical protein